MRKKLSTTYVLVLAVFGFTVSVAVGLNEIYRHRSFFQEEYKINVWLVAQAQLELLRLVNALDRYVSDVDPASHDDVVMRLDIFWSRLPVLTSGQESKSLRQIPGFADTVDAIQTDLKRIEDKIISLSPDDLATYRMLRDTLMAHAGPLHDAVIATIARDNGKLEQDRETVRRAYWQLTLSIIGAFAGGAIVIFFLMRSIRHTARLLKTANDAEQDARQARAQLSEAIEAISEGFVLYGPNRRLLVANRKIADIYAKVGELMVPGADFEQIGREAVRRGQYAGLAIEQVDDQPELFDYHGEGEHEIELSDGRWIRMTRRRTADGGSVSVHSDITELKHREQELASKSQQLQATLDNIIQGVSVFDRHRTLRTWNEQFLRLLDLPLDPRTRELSLDDILAAQVARGDFGDPRAALPLVERLGVPEDASSARLELSLPSGRAIELHKGTMPEGGTVFTYTDITERRCAEKRHQQLMDEIHQSQKMQAIGTLAGGIAHDFNNILASILGNVELALDDLEEIDPAYESVVQIQSAGVRAQKVVEQILAFSRHEAVEAKPIQLNRVVDETVKLLRATLPSSIELAVDMACRKPTIVGDPTQMHQALMNLCVNAGHAIGDGHGTIAVSLAPVAVQGGFAQGLASEKKDATGQPMRLVPAADGRGGSLWVGLLSPGPHFRLTVSDTGCGMSYETMSRMLEPFFTTKGVGAGTGLGLSAVHGIVTKHRGAMVVESRLGEGSTFSIFLPQAAAAPSEPAVAPPAARLEHRGSERIMIIDDEVQLLDAALRTLKRAGFEVDGMSSSVEALERFRADPARWDLIITDQTMPKMTGAALAEEMLRVRPDLPIILCTGYSATMDDEKAKAIGVREFALKPVVGSALTGLARRTIDRSKAPVTAS